MNLQFDLSFQDLYTSSGLERLDQHFLKHLEGAGEGALAVRLQMARACPPAGFEESALLLDISPHLEDFLAALFRVQKEIAALQDETYALSPLWRCKRLFVQRQAAKAFSAEEAATFKGPALKDALSELMGEPYTDLAFARHVLAALDGHSPVSNSVIPDQDILTPRKRGLRLSKSGMTLESSDRRDDTEDANLLYIATQYAAWAIHQDKPSPLFRIPRKIDQNALIPLKKEGPLLVSSHPIHREGFDCTDPGASFEEALDQANYCIICHPQAKDSCSKGLSEEKQGCPLEQKISEMNALRVKGHVVGALAMIMVDNPMVAATGRRICNACQKACIFQKQNPVDIPSIETQTLEGVLDLPWGVEIYALLSRWNPLNLRSPLPKPSTGYKVLVAGMGPAGFTLAHYLLNAGHRVVGIDGLKIDPLEPTLLNQPIASWADLKVPLSQRTVTGFGGVAEYGITARWDKNYLTLIRLLLERRAHFSLYDGVRLGGTLTLPQAFELGFDHVALCLGAGKPTVLPLKNALARGVRVASDFLMALQLTGASQEDSLANLQIRLPLMVVGGGLTAVDTATEALAYYPIQVEKFLKRTEALGGLPPTLSPEDRDIAEEFLADARALRQGDRSCLEKAVTLVYRKRLQDSPSYILNPEELDLGLQQGVTFLEQATLEEITVDVHGAVESLNVITPEGMLTLPCRTLLVAIGTHPNRALEGEDPHLTLESPDFLISYKGEDRVSLFGDLHPIYQGSVVGAMASAKKGVGPLLEALKKRPPLRMAQNLDALFHSMIHEVHRLTPSILEIIVHAPQAARNFRPGQFFRLQNYGLPEMEGIALTGAGVDREKGLISLIVLEMGASTILCHSLKPGGRVVLMGPTGTPTTIPIQATVLLIGGGLGNAVLFSIGHALKQAGSRVIYVAGYKTPEDRFKAEAIETIADHVIWCSEESPGFVPSRPQDQAHVGNVIEGLLAYAALEPPIPLSEVTHLLTIGSDRMMAAVACARKTVLKEYLNPNHIAIGSINSPMQCMMKEICGQCIQLHKDPLTQETRVVFSCVTQDQNLDHVDFENLQGRLAQNSLLEKQTYDWVVRR